MPGGTRSTISEEGEPAVVAIHRKGALEAGVVIALIAGQVASCTEPSWRGLVERVTSSNRTTSAALTSLKRLARRRGETLTVLRREVVANVQGH